MRSGKRRAGFGPTSGSGPGWIVAIARNAAIDRLRLRRAPTRDIADMVDLADPAGTGGGAAASDDRRRIEGCLGAAAGGPGAGGAGGLFEGHTYEELARTFEVPLNTMRTWLRRALIALRKCLEPMSDR